MNPDREAIVFGDSCGSCPVLAHGPTAAAATPSPVGVQVLRNAVAEPLAAAGYRVLAVDWPAHGRSDAPAEPRTVTATLLAGVLADLVKALDLGPALFIGNSVGGYAAARLALEQPARPRALRAT